MTASNAHKAPLNGLCLVLACRAVCGLLLENPAPCASLALSVMVGGLITLPALLLIQRLESGSPMLPAVALLLILDGADIALRAAQSAWFISLDRVPVRLLLIPLLPALLPGASYRRETIDYTASILAWILLPLGLLIVALQLRSYRPAWLFPLLGSGPRDIVVNGMRVAGWAGLYATALAGSKRPPLKAVLGRWTLALGSAALAIALASMVTPYSLRRSDPAWLNRLDALITNGRSSLYLQLPVMVVWFLGLLYVIRFDGALASSLMHSTLGLAGRGRRINALTAALMLGVATTGFMEGGIYAEITRWQWIPLCLICPMMLLCKGGSAFYAGD